MSRFVQEATASGATSDVLGTGSTTFCGSGTQLYDVPGALTPIYVCCNWTTPISGLLDICVNFSLYDCLVVRGTSTTHCCHIDGVMVVPSNACIDTLMCAQCYCGLNHWYSHQYSGHNCNIQQSQGCLCTGNMRSWSQLSYWEFTFKYGQGVYSCDCACKSQHLSASIFYANHSNSKRYDVQAVHGNNCCYRGFWPTETVDSIEKIPDLGFCKFVIRGSDYNCFTPLLCCTCEVCGAFFGVWGSLKSNPFVSGKSDAYK